MTGKYCIFLTLDRERFREYLSESKWSVRDLAMAVGTSERTIYRSMSEGRQESELMDVLRNVIVA